MFDKAAMRFQAKVMTVAQKYFNASCEGSEAEPFLDAIYRDYIDNGSPQQVEEWIKQRLTGEFMYVTEPPGWVEEEPSWPFLDGKPMVYVTQTTLPRNEVTERKLTWNGVVYLFGSRIDLPQGYRVEYRTVVQHEGLDGTGLF